MQLPPIFKPARATWLLLPLLAVSLQFTRPAQAALKEGERAPSFQLQASLNGKAFAYSLQEQLKQGPVVVYFYPSAFTGGCNIQARQFAVKQGQFAAAGASIIGVSLDNIARLNDFSADPESCAGKVAVASDPDGSVARAYALTISQGSSGKKDTRGVEIDHDFAERTTFIVTREGKVASVIGGVSPIDNVEQALQAVQKLAGKH
jgi:thioredoxin-dependent peroxiredoxin